MARAEELTWVLVCGGFRPDGGMDRANAALARYLIEAGAAVHLVTHDADPALVSDERVRLTRVARPLSSSFAGELALDRAARSVVAALRASGRRVCAVGNGGSFTDADINWVHSVHHAWPCRHPGAPAWFRLKNRLYKSWARARERRALAAPPAVIANSHRTARDLTQCLGIPAGRIHTIYLGSDPAWQPPDHGTRAQARARWMRNPQQPLVAFIGALGYDTNKGIDRMLDAWRTLRASGWAGELVVAGSGSSSWKAKSADLGESVRFVGHISDTGSLLDAADLLVSPVIYEAYGLAVHEALCRGIPAIVTASAGIVERLPASFADLLLPPEAAPAEIAARTIAWLSAQDRWRREAAEVSVQLRRYSEHHMAEQLVAVAAMAAA